MARKKGRWALLMAAGTILGLFAGELVAGMLPPGVIHDILSRSVPLGLTPPFGLEMKFLSVTLGFQVRLTVTALLGLLAAFWFGRNL
jgi:hypothetical protein